MYIKNLKPKIEKTKIRSGEQLGTITVATSTLKAITIRSNLSPYLIDEYPILSIAASQAKGITYMKGLDELRHKESDRIKSIVGMLKSFGIRAEIKEIEKENEVISSRLYLGKIQVRLFSESRLEDFEQTTPEIEDLYFATIRGLDIQGAE